MNKNNSRKFSGDDIFQVFTTLHCLRTNCYRLTYQFSDLASRNLVGTSTEVMKHSPIKTQPKKPLLGSREINSIRV